VEFYSVRFVPRLVRIWNIYTKAVADFAIVTKGVTKYLSYRRRIVCRHGYYYGITGVETLFQ